MSEIIFNDDNICESIKNRFFFVSGGRVLFLGDLSDGSTFLEIRFLMKYFFDLLAIGQSELGILKQK
jgi:hypothetical protein